MTLQNWQSPEELPLLAVGISQQTQYRAPFVDDFAGRTIHLVDAYGREIGYDFQDAHSVSRSDDAGTVAATYDATRVRQGIYLIDVILPGVPGLPGVDLASAAEGLPANETWALNATTGCVTTTTSFVYTRSSGDKWTKSVDLHWWVADGPRRGQHPRSSGMVGKRVMWQYSDTDRYDHVYLNDSNFAWQCISGVEQGLTELDRTRAYDVADDLYFFGWSEHVQPIEPMLFVDMADMMTYGRMFGWEERTGEILHHQFGARGVLLNTTSYPEAAL